MFIILAIIGLPFVLFAPGLIHNSHLMLMLSLCFGFCASCYQGKPIIKILLYYICIHAIVTVVSLKASKGFYIEVMFIATGFALLNAVVKQKRITLAHWVRVMCIIGITHSVIALAQRCGMNVAGLLYWGPIDPGPVPISSFYGNPNYLAVNVAITLPFFFRPKWVWWAVLPITTVMTSSCFGAMVAACVGTVFFIWHQNGIKCVRLILLCVGVVGLLPVMNMFLNGGQDIFGDVRWAVWGQTVLKVISGGWDRVLFGFGSGQAHTDHVLNYVHNDFLFVFYRYGLVGVGLVVAVIARIIIRLKPDVAVSSAAVVFSLGMLSSNLIQFAPAAMLMLVVVGLAEREGEEERHAIWQII